MNLSKLDHFHFMFEKQNKVQHVSTMFDLVMSICGVLAVVWKTRSKNYFSPTAQPICQILQYKRFISFGNVRGHQPDFQLGRKSKGTSRTFHESRCIKPHEENVVVIKENTRFKDLSCWVFKTSMVLSVDAMHVL